MARNCGSRRAASGSSFAWIPETGLELERFEDIPGSDAAKDGDLVWSLTQDDPTVVVTDLSTGKVVASIEVPAEPKQIVITGGSVWVACDTTGVLVRIDPKTYQVVDTIDVGAGPVELELGFDSLWVRNRSSSSSGSTPKPERSSRA